MAKRILSILAVVCLLVGVSSFTLVGSAADVKAADYLPNAFEVFSENFDAVTGFNEWGELVGSKGVNFPRGSGTNAYHEMKDGSLIVKKTADATIESVAFGNSSYLRLSPDKTYAFTFTMKALTELPTGAKMVLCMMNWEANNGCSNWSNELQITKTDDGFTVNATDKSYMMDGAIVEKNGMYYVSAIFKGMPSTNAGGPSAFVRIVFQDAKEYNVAVDDVVIYETDATAAADFLPGTVEVFSENFDAVTGFNEWGELVGSKGVNFPRGSGTNAYHEMKDGSLIVKKTADATIESVAFGNSSYLRLSPDKTYAFTFTMAPEAEIPTGAKMVLCMMNWEANNGCSNWSNELQFTKTDDGFTVNATDKSYMMDGAIVEKNGVYYVSAIFKGMPSTNAGGPSAFVRIVFQDAKEYNVAVDDVVIYETDATAAADFVADGPFTENFDAVTGFNEWGELVGSKGVNFPRGSGTNAYHEMKDGSLIVKKTADATIESVAFGNSAYLRLSPDKTYAFTFTMAPEAEIPTGAKMIVCMMNWEANNGCSNWSNELQFTKTDDGFTVNATDKSYMMDGAIKEVNGVYYVSAIFKGMPSTNAGGPSAFVRLVFQDTKEYTVAVDDVVIQEAVAKEGEDDEEEIPAPVLENYSQIGDALFADEMERAYEVNDAGNCVNGSCFNWPWAGGAAYVEILKDDDRVINGAQSILLTAKDKDDAGHLTTNPLLSGFTANGFESGKTYVASFLVDTTGLADDGYLEFVVRTWGSNDKWITLNIAKDGSVTMGEYTQTVTDYAVRDLGNNRFGIALRFKRVGSTTANYLFWKVRPGNEVVLDDLAIYESDKDAIFALYGVDEEIPEDDNTGDDNTGDDNTGDDNTGDDNVQTGVSAVSAVISAVTMMAGAGAMMISRKKRK